MPAQEVTKRLPAKKISTEKGLPAEKRLGPTENDRCAVVASLRLFATKWKPCIICYLAAGPLRYNQLYRAIPNISRKMLSQHLDQLEADGLILRAALDKKLQHVEYSLSSKGRSVLGLMHVIEDWGLTHLTNVVTIDEMVARAQF